MTQEPDFTPEQRLRYAERLRTTGNASLSARALGFSPSFIKRYRLNDEEFDALCKEAEDEAADALEAEARRRALEGVTRVRSIGSRTQFADTFERIEEQEYSDSLLVRLLEANKPDKFAKRSDTRISNPDGSLKPALSDTEIAAKLASFIAAAEARRGKSDEPDAQ